MATSSRLLAGIVRLCFVAVVILTCTESVQAERRVALVIGNGAYEHATRLPNPKNDATDVSAALKRAGFDTIVGIDLDREGMDDAAIRFARAAREADVALFYYSGHAMQFAGVNYLMPVDAKLTDEADLRRMARVDTIVADLQQAKNLRVLVLDSCRDNPLAETLKRSIGRSRAASIQRGLAKIESPEGMIVAYATQSGRTADDGDGRNSPYTTAFLRHIEQTEEIGRVFRRISADVYETTKRQQLPELSLSFIGEFYLNGRPVSAGVPTSAGTAPKTVPFSAAAQAWAVTQNSTSVAVLETFVRRFSGTVYADLARARLEELEKDKPVVKSLIPMLSPMVPKPQPKAVAEEHFNPATCNRRPC